MTLSPMVEKQSVIIETLVFFQDWEIWNREIKLYESNWMRDKNEEWREIYMYTFKGPKTITKSPYFHNI